MSNIDKNKLRLSSEELEKICGGTLDEKLSKLNLKPHSKFGPRVAYGLINPRDEIKELLEKRNKENTNNEEASLTQVVTPEKDD